jgi:hypothetical protein
MTHRRRRADSSRSSVFRQQLEPLSFRQVAWRNYLKVPPVKSGYLMQVQPFGERYYASIHDLEPQRGVGGEQLGHPPVVMRRDLDDTELVVGDGGAEFGGQANAPAPLRIGQQVTDLGDGKRRDHQARPVAGEERRSPGMIAVSFIEGGDKRPRIAQDHADAAPLASSRSG